MDEVSRWPSLTPTSAATTSDEVSTYVSVTCAICFAIHGILVNLLRMLYSWNTRSYSVVFCAICVARMSLELQVYSPQHTILVMIRIHLHASNFMMECQ